MRMVRLDEEGEVRGFAKKAAKNFAENELINTFTDGADIYAGCLFALRWGFGDDCVLVFRLDEDFEPVNYQQLIETYVEDTEEVG